MIWASKRLHDEVFRAKTLKTNGLEPKALPDSWKREGAYFEDMSYKRVVERHPWGAIVYLTNRLLNEHYTVVCRGYFDIWSGVVSDEGNVTENISAYVPWYQDMIALERPGPHVSNAPPCIGYHVGADPKATEADRVICDGGTNAETGVVEPACSWRQHCVIFQQWCRDRYLEPKAVIEGRAPEEIVRIVLGAVNSPPVRKPTVQRETAQKTEEAEMTKRRQVLADTSMKIFRILATELKRNFVHERQFAKPGDFFVVDRRLKSNYLAFYCEPEPGHGRAIPIMQARFRPRLMVLVVNLPVTTMRPELDPVRDNCHDVKIGEFQTGIKIDSDAPPALVANVVSRLVKAGAIVLPKVQRKYEGPKETRKGEGDAAA